MRRTRTAPCSRSFCSHMRFPFLLCSVSKRVSRFFFLLFPFFFCFAFLAILFAAFPSEGFARTELLSLDAQARDVRAAATRLAALRDRVLDLVYRGRYDEALDEAGGFLLVTSVMAWPAERVEYALAVGYIASRRGDDEKALALAERARELLRSSGRIPEEMPETLRSLRTVQEIRMLDGVIRAFQGVSRWDDASATLEELKALAERTGSDYGKALAALSGGVAAYREGRHAEAERLWQEAFRRGMALLERDASRSASEEMPGNPEIAGLAANHLARLSMGVEDPARTRERFRVALEIALDVPSPWLEFVVRLNRAEFLDRYAFEAEESLADLERCEALAVSLGLSSQRLWVWNNLAVFFLSRGEYGRAKEELDRALRFQMSPAIPEDVGVYVNAGTLALATGEEQEAERAFRRALELAQERGDRRAEAGILVNLGILARRGGQLEEAKAHFGRALDGYHALGMEREATDLMVNMANLGIVAEDWELAERALDVAAEDYAEVNDVAGLALVTSNRGVVRLRQGRFVESETCFEEALVLARRVEDAPLAFAALHGLARARVALGDGEAALGPLREAVDLLETIRARFASVEQRVAFLEHRYDAYDLLVDLLVERGELEEALSVSERMKARSFLDVAGGGQVELRETDRELYEALAALEGELERLAAKKSALLSEGTPDEERRLALERIERKAAELREKLASLRSRVALASPELAALSAPAPPSVAEMRRLLPSDVLVVSYHLLPSRTLAFLVTRDGVRCVPLPLLSRQAVEDAVNAALPSLRTPEAEPPFLELSRLYLGLVAPLENVLYTAPHVVVIPQGILAAIPFQTFWTGTDYLLQRAALSYAPSLGIYTLLAARRSAEATRSRPLRFLGFGNPVFSDGSLAPLPFAEQEVLEVAPLFSASEIFFGADATETRLFAKAAGFDVVHLSTHAMADGRRPLNSTIYLAADGEDDGELRASEVFRLPLNADCVVLSACETGLGQLSHAEGLIGFSRSFFHAGTSSLLASLWSVFDASTKDLFVLFYKNWLSGDTKSQALRKAQVTLLERLPHPAFWAPFVLLGEER